MKPDRTFDRMQVRTCDFALWLKPCIASHGKTVRYDAVCFCVLAAQFILAAELSLRGTLLVCEPRPFRYTLDFPR